MVSRLSYPNLQQLLILKSTIKVLPLFHTRYVTHLFIYITYAHASHQSKYGGKPVETVLKDKNIQGADEKDSTVQSISRPTKTTVNSINFANTAMTHLDTINNVYLRPFRTFSTVVNGIANVCLPNLSQSTLDSPQLIGPSIRSDSTDRIDRGR